MFEFMNIDRIEGEEIDLLNHGRFSADAEKGYVPCYSFYILLHGTDIKIGGCNIRIGYNRNTFYGGNIGYMIDEDYRGHRYAAKACKLLKPIAKAHGLQYLIITNTPDNIASRRICEIIGAELSEIVQLPADNEMYLEGAREKCRYYWDLRKDTIMNIDIRKLNQNLISDYIDFFDNRAFADNIEWSACYCVFFHWNDTYDKSLKAPGVDIHDHNRNLAVELIKRGILQGYLAYENDMVVGWVNVNDKTSYETLNPGNRPDLWDDGNSSMKVKSITCFTIAPDYRRKGIASALLKKALDDACEEGYDIAEAYTRIVDNPERNYHGHDALYVKAGFETYKILEKEKILRKNLKD